MKTILLPLFALFCLCTTIQAQFEMASAAGAPPFEYGSGAEPEWSKSEPAVVVPANTTDDRAVIRLGSGFRSAVNVQVLSPDTDLVINRDVVAGQSQLTIDLAGLPDGTYTVRLQIGAKRLVRQLVKS